MTRSTERNSRKGPNRLALNRAEVYGDPEGTVTRPSAPGLLSIDDQNSYRLCFNVFGRPVPLPRPRHRRNGWTFTPRNADEWQFSIRHAAILSAARSRVSTAPVPSRSFAVWCFCRFSRMRKDITSDGKLRLSAARHHVSRPDADNLLKAAVDAMGSLRGRDRLFWWDDSQIVSKSVQKRWCAPRERAGMVMVIECRA